MLKKAKSERRTPRKSPLIVLATRSESDAPDQTLHAIAERARVYGWELLDLIYTGGVLPKDRPISGAIVNCLPTEPLAVKLRKMDCPAVRLGRLPHPNDNIFPAVVPDLAEGGRMAANHFAERGFKNVGYIGRSPTGYFVSFYESFKARTEEAFGSKCHSFILKQQHYRSKAEKYKARSSKIIEWLSAMPRPFGLVTFSDRNAAALCTMCESAGLNVPADVAILGNGNNSVDCDVAPVPLSSIDWGAVEQGRQAATLLRHIKRGGDAPKEAIMVGPAGVVARRSTDMLALEDRTVARAVRFIWDHIAWDLSVDDVVDSVGLPRRRLERAFRKNLARGIHAELRRKRLERCCELLRTTNLRISDIAAETGFASADNLHLAFKRKFGVTPRKYRLGDSA